MYHTLKHICKKNTKDGAGCGDLHQESKIWKAKEE